MFKVHQTLINRYLTFNKKKKHYKIFREVSFKEYENTDRDFDFHKSSFGAFCDIFAAPY